MIDTSNRTLRRLAVIAAVSVGTLIAPHAQAAADVFAQAPADTAVAGVTRTELLRLPAPTAGFDIVQTRVEIPVGMESGMHSHPGPEIGYIVQGDVDMIFNDQPTQHLHSGQPFNIAANTVHDARNVGTVPTLMLSTYIIDASQPLATPR